VSIRIGNGNGIFGSPTDYHDFPGGPTGLSIRDFDGDGHDDIAVATHANGSIRILNGRGDGTFVASARRFGAGSYEFGFAAGDFNKDGKPDFAVGSGTSLNVILGRGDGVFEAPQAILSGNSPYNLVPVDLNGDGNMDIVSSNNGDNTISVVLGNGDGTFPKAVGYSTDSKPGNLSAADFNGDGKIDLVVISTASYNLDFFYGNGDGTLQSRTQYTQYNGYPDACGAGDFNGDGAPDVAVAVGGKVFVVFRNADGTCTKSQMSTVSTSFTINALEAADFDSDGKADLVCVTSQPAVAFVKGSGDGKFTLKKNCPFDGQGFDILGLAMGDFNADGVGDVAVANPFLDAGSDAARVMYFNSDSTMKTSSLYAMADPKGIAGGLFDDDEVLDLAVGSGGARVGILSADGQGLFGAAELYNTSFNVWSVKSADFNNDGRPDLLLGEGGGIEVLLGK
jgi:hypothetical protein